MAINLDGGFKKPFGVQPEMNVTPLVDVVLVLLIIFMVLAPGGQQELLGPPPAQR
jgi:biopolymer transport protein ExbD